MKRYADTFFRFWYIALVPILVIPIAAFGLGRSATPTSTARATIWVGATGAAKLGPVNPYSTPSQTMASYLTQWLATDSFDFQVVKQSPIYWHSLGLQQNKAGTMLVDLSKNLQVQSGGPNVVILLYSTPNAQAGVEVLRAILSQATIRIAGIYSQQVAKSLAAYKSELATARAHLATASQILSTYIAAHHNITANNLASEQLIDPQLGLLTQVVQSDQIAVQTAQQQVAKLTGPSGGSAFQVIDAPTGMIAATSKKSLLMNLGIGLLLGLLLGGGFVVVRTALDESVRYPDEVTPLLDLPVLGVVPFSQVLAESNVTKAGSDYLAGATPFTDKAG